MEYKLIKRNNEEFVFFLHGFGGSKDSFLLAKDYIQADCSLVFLSFTGFGNSPPPEKAYTLDDYADEVKALIDELAKGKGVYVVCHSFGARVLGRLAYKYPALIKKAFIIDGAGVKPRRGVKYYLRVRKYKRLKRKVEKGLIPATMLDKYGSEDYKSLSKVMRQTFVNVVNYDSKTDFKSIKFKVLLMWGERDKDTPMYMAKKLKRWIKRSEFVIAKGAGHFSYLEQFDLFVNLLNYFICDF